MTECCDLFERRSSRTSRISIDAAFRGEFVSHENVRATFGTTKIKKRENTALSVGHTPERLREGHAMTQEELNAELHRLGCGHRWCGPHGFIFQPENTGGVNIEGMNLHFWGCCANISVDIATAIRVLRSLPDGIGHKKMCNAFRELERLPEYPRCLHGNERSPMENNMAVSALGR
jgi:hypothetical protein